MKKMLAEVEKDLSEALARVNAARKSITGGVVEDSARRAGKWTIDQVDEVFDDMDEALAKAVLSFNYYSMSASEKGSDYIEDLKEDIKELREELRRQRQELASGIGEITVIGVLDMLHQRIDGMVQQCRDEGREW